MRQSQSAGFGKKDGWACVEAGPFWSAHPAWKEWQGPCRDTAAHPSDTAQWRLEGVRTCAIGILPPAPPGSPPAVIDKKPMEDADRLERDQARLTAFAEAYQRFPSVVNRNRPFYPH